MDENNEKDKDDLEEAMDADQTMFKITPKGMLVTLLVDLGLSLEQAVSVWDDFESFCCQEQGRQPRSREAELAALVFDGDGGYVMGLDMIDDQEFGQWDDENGPGDDEDDDEWGLFNGNEDK